MIEPTGQKIKITLENFGEEGFGYDLCVLAEDATVGDYVEALDAFQAKSMADCRGCDGCCHERIPLTYGDFFLACKLVADEMAKPEADVSLADWLSCYAELTMLGEAVDLTLKRKADGSCYFLDTTLKECQAHHYRTLVCRTHCCLPKSPRALDLRGQIINCGEDQLVRKLLIGSQPSKWQDQLKDCQIDDYPINGFADFAGEDWAKVLLKSVVSPKLWQEIFNA